MARRSGFWAALLRLVKLRKTSAAPNPMSERLERELAAYRARGAVWTPDPATLRRIEVALFCRAQTPDVAGPPAAADQG
ncbi:hypothetical protein [Phenylobacterium sp.]|jgi:hypothetical protein|uniref:hypothetical protein n=1 Tax=Phenylobacterium sp. TaxID=1871053 RepID=UPI002F932800